MLRLGVIGHPITHSRSPAMHTAALHALAIEGEYNAYDVAPAGLPGFLALAKRRGMRGLNVTIPHKEAVLRLCEPNELAGRVGAVNTLIFEGERVLGSNTDVYGFVKLLESVSAPVHGRVLVLGTGGAARAILTALVDRSDVVVVGRKAGALALSDRALAVAPWAELPSLLRESALLVDCTPRGLDPTVAPLDLSPLPSSAVVIDLVVAKETRLVHDARARGLTAATGTEMLLHQGARALELWTGRDAPIEVMRQALLASL